jgi:hypothetical protein
MPGLLCNPSSAEMYYVFMEERLTIHEDKHQRYRTMREDDGRMYTYLYNPTMNFIERANWVICLLLVIAIPVIAFIAGMWLVLSGEGEGEHAAWPEWLLPGLAMLEGIYYAFLSTGGSTQSRHSLWLFLTVLEAVCAVAVLMYAIGHGYKNPFVFTLGSFILGFAPFDVMAIIAGIVFGLQLLGFVILGVFLLYLFEHTNPF